MDGKKWNVRIVRSLAGIYMEEPMLKKSLIVAGAILFATSAFAQSQSTTGWIQGTIADANGAVVPNTTVTISNLDTGLERTLTTNSDGGNSGAL